MSIKKISIPKNTVLLQAQVLWEYSDSFKGEFNDPEKQVTPKEVGKAFFSSAPNWVEKLFMLREKIVSLFGLKTAGKVKDRQKIIDNFQAEPGEQIGLFRVYNKTKDELIFGEDDKHLNFRVSLLLSETSSHPQKRSLIFTTTVKFNNFMGKCYFAVVRPFHGIIVPVMLKGMLKQLGKKQN